MSDKRDKAYQDYLNGMKYADIAAKHDVSPNNVKSWATRYWKNKKAATKEKKLQAENNELQPPPRKKGGANNVKHGAYCGFFADILTDEERNVMSEREPDLEQKLIEEINISDILIKRLLKQIAKYQESHKLDDEEIGVLTGVTRIVRETHGKNEKEIIKDTDAAYLYLKVLGEQLAKTRAEKNKAIKNLADFRAKNSKKDDDKIAVIDDWIAAVLGSD